MAVDMTQVSSSWIAAIGYENGTIYMETNDGDSYEYPGTEEQFKEWLAAPSKGRWFMENLR